MKGNTEAPLVAMQMELLGSGPIWYLAPYHYWEYMQMIFATIYCGIGIVVI